MEGRDGEPAGLTIIGRGGSDRRGKGQCCSLNQGQAAALLINPRGSNGGGRRGGGQGRRVIEEGRPEAAHQGG